MFDAQIWLEKYCKRHNISQNKITDAEFEDVEEALELEMENFLREKEVEFMESFMFSSDWENR